MAITLGQILDFPSSALARYEPRGSTFIGIVELLGDAAYPTGGYPITAALVGLNQLQWVVPLSANGGVVPAWDQVNSKLKLLNGNSSGTYAANAAMSECAASSTNVSTATKIYLLVSGI